MAHTPSTYKLPVGSCGIGECDISSRLHVRSWLHSTLQAERETVMSHLEERHQEMMLEVDRLFDVNRAGQHRGGVFTTMVCPMQPSDDSHNVCENFDLPDISSNAEAVTVAGDPTTHADKSDTGMLAGTSSTCSQLPNIVGAVGQFDACRSNSNLESYKITQRSNRFATRRSMLYLARQLVTSRWFEVAFAIVIVFSTVAFAMEIHYKGIDIGFEMGYAGFGQAARHKYPYGYELLKVLDWIFGVLFTIEIALKAVVLGSGLLRSLWNWLDMVIVLVWVLSTAIGIDISLNPLAFRLLRLLRLVRLLRVLKTVSAFDSLYLLVGSITASVSALLWSSVILMLVQTIMGLLLNQLLESYMTDTSKPLAKREAVFAYFGTFSRTMLTMFEITLANWVPVCRLLNDNVREAYGLLIVLYRYTVGFAVVKVITGVFLHETFQVASSDDNLMVIQKQRNTEKYVRKMKLLFCKADKSGDDFVDEDELKTILRDPRMSLWLSAMELEVNDSKVLFNLLDNGDGKITVGELVRGVARLRGSARSIDLIALAGKLRSIESNLAIILNNLIHIRENAVRTR